CKIFQWVGKRARRAGATSRAALCRIYSSREIVLLARLIPAGRAVCQSTGGALITHQGGMLGVKRPYLGAAALAAVLVAGRGRAAPAVTGDYVESRSANVYVGACHHEGEIQTAGRNAVMAWNITEGEYNGVSLQGVKVVAVVAADKHLEFADAK